MGGETGKKVLDARDESESQRAVKWERVGGGHAAEVEELVGVGEGGKGKEGARGLGGIVGVLERYR